MKVTLLANAGIFVESAGIHILVDGLHRKKMPRFSPVAPEIVQDLIDGKGEFKRVGYALVTHDHPDHFNPVIMQQFLEAHPETELVAPQFVPGADLHRQVRVTGSEGDISLPALDVHFLRIQHEGGPECEKVTNYGYRVTTSEDSFVVLGDAAIAKTENAISELTKNAFVDAVFLDFPLLTLASGREALRNLQAKKIFAFHLPFEQDDEEGFRASAAKGAREAEAMLQIPVILLDEPGQCEVL